MQHRPLARRASAMIALAALAGFPMIQAAPAAAAGSSTLVINEVYARGGSANQPFNTKFVELANLTDAPIALTGHSLGYSSASNLNVGQTCALTGEIAAGGHYVVGVGSNGSNGAPISVDQTCTNINPSGTNGSYTLLDGTTTVDLVGWGSAVRYETQAAVYTGGNTTAGSISRTDGVDTDNNRADFTFSATPTPANQTPGEPEEPVVETVAIAEIQGTGSASPMVGQQVTTVGVVTAVYPTGGFNGFYLQTPGSGGAADATPGASDGIFVYGTTDVAIGECQTVSGTVAEYYGLTQLSRVTLTPAADCAPVQPTPLAALPTEAEREGLEGMLVLPQGAYTITNNYQLNQYGQLGLAFGTEPLYQATDVVAPGPEAIAYEQANLAKYITLDDGSSWDYLRNAAAQDSPLPYLSQDEPMRTGSKVTFTAPVILDYRYQWNYQPVGQIVGSTDADDPLATENDRELTAPEVGGDVRLATFNVLNYFTNLGYQEDEFRNCPYYADRDGNPVTTNYCEVRGAWSEEAFADQKAKLIAAINELGAGIVGLSEIENSAGITWISHERDYTLAMLVDELNAAGGSWAYAESPVVTPDNEDVIRVAYIYDPTQVKPLNRGEILLDEAFANARYPLMQRWKATHSGTQFYTVANHFKSKGSGEDDGTGQGLSNPSREAQARALTAWVDTFTPGGAVFLIGDFNAYSAETPVQIIEDAGYTNVVKAYEPDSATYQFSGRLGSLDHIFANDAAMKLVTGAAVWDINADESIAMQYSRRNYNVVDFFAETPFASSDHDPAIVGIKIKTGKPNR